MKKLSKVLFLCFLCAVIGVCLTACFDDDADENENPTPENTTYVFQVYDADGNFSRTETVEKGKTDYYVDFGMESYDFYGYFTEKNGKGNRITDENGKVLKDFTAPNDATSFSVYPYVSVRSYRLTFQTNGTEVIPDETHSATDAFPLPNLSRNGYEFKGWSERSDDWTGFTEVYAGQFYRDTTLYGIFKAKETTLSYESGVNSAGGSGSVSVYYGQIFEVPYLEFFGYNFAGYYTEKDGQGDCLTNSDGKSLSPWDRSDRHVSIYAHYQPAEIYTLTYENDRLVTGITVTYHDWDRSNGVPQDRTEFYRDGDTVPYLVPRHRNGYYFDGWFSDAALRNKYDFTVAETLSEDLELYAGWKELPTYPVQYSPLSGAVKSGSLRLFYETPSDDVGYYCDFDGTFTVKYKVNLKPVLSGETAGLIRINIGLESFEVEDGAEGSVAVTVKKGSIFRISGNPLGYYQVATLEYEIGDFPKVESQKQVKVPSEFTVKVTHGNHYELPVYNIGYEFVGYFTEPNGKGTRLTDENGDCFAVWTLESDATVYIYYKRN